MKSILISIRPKWCEKIAKGEKTIEVRKTRPKLETPFKCYIYCTNPKFEHEDHITLFSEQRCFYAGGKVIGEFVCDVISQYEAELWDDNTFERIREFYEPDDFAEYGEYEYQTIADNGDEFWKDNMLCKASCVSVEELRNYIGQGIHEFYGWHISDLVIYDTPKKLSEFYKNGTLSNDEFVERLYDGRQTYAEYLFTRALRKPPQSWCYVEN